MKSLSVIPDGESTENTSAPLYSFCKAWAQRYIRQVDAAGATEVIQTRDDRAVIAAKLQQDLRSVSVKAWGKAEHLLEKEIIRHQIPSELIDPWGISQDIYRIYLETLNHYADGVAPERFAIAIAGQIGDLRHQYTVHDPRVIGFASMQFHYTGQLLLQGLPFDQRTGLNLYFKAVDDHLYMPIQRTYQAAANYAYDDPQLRTVRRLLGSSSSIAHRIVDQVLKAFPNHHCYSGPLGATQVRISSLRDVEMFQTYLWVCLLENSISAVQRELFPLCTMLYPVLNVRWELVRYMLMLLDHELSRQLDARSWKQLREYLNSLRVMFSAEVFDNQVCFA
ncbi:hypothetical protein [Leptolyngbya sp. PCC 6406]|uniref:hypothetical protein n=1 Tax=Leptolyngbya sp. PCC 6406 TaxID=1173264 RepID=UPI0002AC65C2|nr:hypothetical protein [Leptolyngbya sp. PCC 6406]